MEEQSVVANFGSSIKSVEKHRSRKLIAGLIMEEMISWLIGLERMAFNLYEEAAEYFKREDTDR